MMTIYRPIRRAASGWLTLLSLTLAGVLLPPALQAQDAPGGEAIDHEEQPRLLVFLVVDQLRGDLLNRYSSVFQGGLKRILDGGLSFTQALHNHAATETAPGHAALSTGVNPGRAGIPSNAWRQGSERDAPPIYNVVDPDYALVGVSGLPGASPSVLRREGLADWVLQADPRAKVVSVSAKDRAAVLMAGKSKGNVFWFNSTVGRFVTSSYYRSRNPSWLTNFNEQVLEKYRSQPVWSSTVPPEVADLSAPDTAAFEGDGVHTFFPHVYKSERIDPDADDFFLWFETTPMLDEATLALARLALKETGSGTAAGRTDFLSVSLSQTDRVGHAFGPLSREQMDNLLRLDRALGEFLDFLDEWVGPEHYVLGLTADHGVMTAPERLQVPGRRLGIEDRSRLESSLGSGVRKAQRNRSNDFAPFLLEAMSDLDFVGPAYSRRELGGGEVGDSIEVLFQHSFVPDRPGGLLSPYGVEMWWADHILPWSVPSGTTHGGPFYHDRWVPLILMGPGIRAGEEERPVMPLSLAPTLAWLADIPFPGDLDGEPLIGKEGEG